MSSAHGIPQSAIQRKCLSLKRIAFENELQKWVKTRRTIIGHGGPRAYDYLMPTRAQTRTKGRLIV